MEIWIGLRIPMGLMFTLVGLILSVFGFMTSGDAMYAKSGASMPIWDSGPGAAGLWWNDVYPWAAEVDIRGQIACR